jgi:hypothetical protein
VLLSGIAVSRANILQVLTSVTILCKFASYPLDGQPLPPLAGEYSRACDRWDSSRIWRISLI